MQSSAVQNPAQAQEIRALTDAEVDDVNGGILGLLVGALLFETGFTIGAIIANLKYTNNWRGEL